MAKFTDQSDGPVYIDLLQVAAITDVYSSRDAVVIGSAYIPGIAIGARVILMCGTALFTKESADTVFEEVHRARTEQQPKPQPIRVGNAPIGDTPQGGIR